MPLNIKPLGDRVVVKAIAVDEVSKAGIILPETMNKEKSEQGEVMVVGPGKVLENGSRAAMSVMVGNKVLFKKYGPDEVKVDGVDYLIVDESDILAIIG